MFIMHASRRAHYSYRDHLTSHREVAENTVFQAGYVGSASRKLTALTDMNPFVLGTFDRVLNLTPPSSPCGASDPFLCYASLHEFRNTSSASYNSLLASLQKQFSGPGIFGNAYFT